ncbi:MAG TPA: hypothetical protein VHA53_02325 [Nitrolancea sp.]|nr:hypothetical protein [Nitrolancea sp.]
MRVNDYKIDEAETSTVSGKILIAGTGFIVGAGMWAILAFFRFGDGNNGAMLLDLTLAVVHIVVGLMILRQVRNAWYVGLALAGISIAATLPNGYFLPIAVDGITGALLYFARSDFREFRMLTGHGE